MARAGIQPSQIGAVYIGSESHPYAVKPSGTVVAEAIGAEDVFGDATIAKVSVIGVGMKNHSGVASLMFNALARENINIIMISTSEIRISCIIEEKYTELAVRVLHTAFGLDRED